MMWRKKKENRAGDAFNAESQFLRKQWLDYDEKFHSMLS